VRLKAFEILLQKGAVEWTEPEKSTISRALSIVYSSTNLSTPLRQQARTLLNIAGFGFLSESTVGKTIFFFFFDVY
jgi:hypothetical protein